MISNLIKLWAFIEGKKTYICLGLTGLLGGAALLGYIDKQTLETLATIGGSLGLVSFRLAMGNYQDNGKQFLANKKTYIVAVLMFLWGIAGANGWVDQKTFETILTALGSIGGILLRFTLGSVTTTQPAK